MNVFEFVLGIIVVVSIASVFKARYGVRKDMWGNETPPGAGAETLAENARLREELRSLRERVQVLERVVTDTEGSVRLDREIEQLRDNNRA